MCYNLTEVKAPLCCKTEGFLIRLLPAWFQLPQAMEISQFDFGIAETATSVVCDDSCINLFFKKRWLKATNSKVIPNHRKPGHFENPYKIGNQIQTPSLLAQMKASWELYPACPKNKSVNAKKGPKIWPKSLFNFFKKMTRLPGNPIRLMRVILAQGAMLIFSVSIPIYMASEVPKDLTRDREQRFRFIVSFFLID